MNCIFLLEMSAFPKKQQFQLLASCAQWVYQLLWFTELAVSWTWMNDSYSVWTHLLFRIFFRTVMIFSVFEQWYKMKGKSKLLEEKRASQELFVKVHNHDLSSAKTILLWKALRVTHCCRDLLSLVLFGTIAEMKTWRYFLHVYRHQPEFTRKPSSHY